MSVTITAHPNETVEALHQLTVELRANDAQPVTVARNVSEVLARSGLARIDLSWYLQVQGFTGRRLAVAIGSFAPAVKAAYTAAYGRPPLRTVREPEGWIVNSYLELDRPLVDRVFAEWSK